MLGETRKRILLADDHKIVAEAVARLLDETFEVARIVHDGDVLLDAARRVPVDAIVSDVTMPRQNGLSVLKQLRYDGVRTPFVFLTVHAEPAVAAAAMRAGANGYVLKTAAGSDLIGAIRTVLAGGRFVQSSLAARHSITDLIAAANLTDKHARLFELRKRGCSYERS